MPLGEGIDPDGERHGARPEHIDHPVVVEAHVEAELLQAAREPPGGDLSLVLAGGARAGDLPRRPDAGRGVRPAQLHGDHAVLLAVLHVHAGERDLAQVQVAAHAEAAHDVVDDDVDLGLGLGLRQGGLLAAVHGGEAVQVGAHVLVDQSVAVRQGLHAVLLDGRGHRTRSVPPENHSHRPCIFKCLCAGSRCVTRTRSITSADGGGRLVHLSDSEILRPGRILRFRCPIWL